MWTISRTRQTWIPCCCGSTVVLGRNQPPPCVLEGLLTIPRVGTLCLCLGVSGAKRSEGRDKVGPLLQVPAIWPVPTQGPGEERGFLCTQAALLPSLSLSLHIYRMERIRSILAAGKSPFPAQLQPRSWRITEITSVTQSDMWRGLSRRASAHPVDVELPQIFPP